MKQRVSKEKPWPPIKGRLSSRTAILVIPPRGLMRRHPGVLAGKLVCDVPCGAGAFSLRLYEERSKVVSVDIDRDETYYADPGKRILAEGNYRLPFADACFDAGVLIEGPR